MHRVGFDVLRRFQAAYIPPVAAAATGLPRVGLPKGTFDALVAAATAQHKTLSEMATELIEKGLSK